MLAHIPQSYNEGVTNSMMDKCNRKGGFAPGSVDFINHKLLGRRSQQPVAAGPCTELYKCTYRGKLVAVKTYRISATSEKDEDEFKQCLLDECRRARTFQHPLIVTPLGLVTTFARFPALVLPYYEKGSVLDYLKLNPTKDVLSFALDIFEAIRYLHKELPTPVAHGGIRGSNILVNDDGRAVLTDLADSRLTTKPCIVMLQYSLGPVRWTAPEILSPAENESAPYNYTPESDIYSFGMTLLELFTLHQPFNDLRSDPHAIIAAVTGKRPTRPTEVEAPQLTSHVWCTIEQMWAQNPRARPTIDTVGKLLQLASLASTVNGIGELY